MTPFLYVCGYVNFGRGEVIGSETIFVDFWTLQNDKLGEDLYVCIFVCCFLNQKVYTKMFVFKSKRLPSQTHIKRHFLVS